MERLDEPTIVIGDFNAVLEHVPMRLLLSSGFRDAAAQAGAGWRPTFPANRGHPPLVTIDHELTSPELHAVSVETFRAGINEHLGLVVKHDSGSTAPLVTTANPEALSGTSAGAGRVPHTPSAAHSPRYECRNPCS